jgi:hypothetical protein
VDGLIIVGGEKKVVKAHEVDIEGKDINGGRLRVIASIEEVKPGSFRTLLRFQSESYLRRSPKKNLDVEPHARLF